MKTAADYPKLNLPPCRLKVAERDGRLCVWDGVRGGGISDRRGISARGRGGASGRGSTANSGFGNTDVYGGRWLVLTPEEWVRRHVLALLTAHKGVPATSIAQEYPVDVNGMTQRADIVVMGADGVPVLLVECKAPGVAIDRDTLAQAFRYNAVLGARHVMLTNGLDHYIYKVTPDGEYLPLREFPEFL